MLVLALGSLAILAGFVATGPATGWTVTVRVPPYEIEAPAVAGTALLGQTLTASEGDWAGSTPMTLTLSWQRCSSDGTGCADIGHSGKTLVLGEDDVGATVRVVVTAQNRWGRTSAASRPTGVVGAPASPATPAPVDARVATFEAGDFSELDAVNSVPGGLPGTLSIESTAYEGSRGVHASTPAAIGNKYARGIFEVSWTSGSDVWYGAALYLPASFFSSAQGWVDVLRWDNWSLEQRSQDQGGLSVTPDGKLVFTKRDLNLAGNGVVHLTAPVTAPSPDAWHWVEVHQRFSATDGQALNELWVDGVRVASSTTANWNGRPITALRVGIVATHDSVQTNRLDLWFDRASISSGALGPR